jgi:2-hydroxychromene-2-carboxylate isomerase
MREVERRARDYGFMSVRWPDPWPGNTLQAMRVATFAQQAGRVVAYSLAAFRQAFAGGKDLSQIEYVLMAAAACELHPNAVLKALETQSIKDRLRDATAEAYQRGVRGVPTVAIGDKLFYGDDRLEDAAAAGPAPPSGGR